MKAQCWFDFDRSATYMILWIMNIVFSNKEIIVESVNYEWHRFFTMSHTRYLNIVMKYIVTKLIPKWKKDNMRINREGCFHTRMCIFVSMHSNSDNSFVSRIIFKKAFKSSFSYFCKAYASVEHIDRALTTINPRHHLSISGNTKLKLQLNLA